MHKFHMDHSLFNVFTWKSLIDWNVLCFQSTCDMKTHICIHRSVCVSSNITVFAWSSTNKWAESRVLMSQID
uniref:Uncharacterized protein n=1 Tax=Caenorhabditis japonica TaxID=281687 RepID=A0A8R1IF06_CAEJA